MQHTADGRVVKAQLDFICEDVNSARYTAPVWAGVLAFLASSQFGLVGHATVLQCIAVVGVIAAVTIAMAKLVHSYNRVARRNHDYDVMQSWFRRFILMQAAISTAWGIVPWLLWEQGHQLNHVFLAGMMAGVIATQAVMRINHIDMFLASFLPVAGLTMARFVFGDRPD